jgi:hypothetical protein
MHSFSLVQPATWKVFPALQAMVKRAEELGDRMRLSEYRRQEDGAIVRREPW